jgi:hypothetical protein
LAQSAAAMVSLAFLSLDVLEDGVLARPLADLRDVCAAEARREPGEHAEVDVPGDGRTPQARHEDLASRCLVGQGDVDELVEVARPEQRGVDDVRPVGGADDEHRLLGGHAIHVGVLTHVYAQDLDQIDYF